MLAEMEPHSAKLRGRSREFFDDMRERLELYGLTLHMSPKQAEWLDSLYTQLLDDDPPPVEDFDS